MRRSGVKDGLELRKVLRRASGDGTGVVASPKPEVTAAPPPPGMAFVGVDCKDIASAAGSGLLVCTGERGLSMARRMSSCRSLTLIELPSNPTMSRLPPPTSCTSSADVEGEKDDALYERVRVGDTGCKRVTASFDAIAGARRVGGADTSKALSEAVLTEGTAGRDGTTQAFVWLGFEGGDPSRDKLEKSDVDDVDVLIGISLTHLPRRPGLSVPEPAS